MTTMVNELINKDNKKFLKNADTVVFRLKENGQSQIECKKEIEVDGYKTEVWKNIEVGTDIAIYEGGLGKQYSYEIEKAFSNISWAKNDLLWHTIVNFLKNDDEIYLEWIAGNNSNILDDNNLSNDMINLKVKRKEKFVGLFHIDHRITHKDSIARMIKLRKI
jgi:hypothetical protein